MRVSIALICFLLATLAHAATQYKVTSKESGSAYIRLELEYTGQDEFYLKEKSTIVKNLLFVLRCYTFTDFDFKIYDPLKQRYEVPQGGIFPSDPSAGFSFPINLAAFTFTYTENPFGFQIRRKEDSSILFSTKDIDIIFSNYYLQIGTYTSTNLVYGFSERFTSHFRVQEGKWTMFPRDRGQMMDEGIGKQTHGYYPIYMEKEAGNKFHMAYFRSSNGLDVIAENASDSNYKLTYKVIGGIIDFRFFLGESNPEQLIIKFQNYLGRSAIPPFWSLGFHQCRWGYKNIDALEKVLTSYQSNGIPLDTIWTDIDYMKDYETFTIDMERFPPDRMQKILEKYHYIPIIEPSIRLGKGYAYEEGKKRNVFIKDAEGNDQVGKVWAGEVVFPDFFNPNATKYWDDMLSNLYGLVKFSGVWLDMNEISNLCNGPCSPPKETGMDFTNDIPYHPGNDTIETQAIPLNATHYGDQLEANVHTFFGFMETYATNRFLEKHGRPFIITRSNTLGSNKYGFHWTGDNYANYSFLKTSISSNFMFNFWGIQMVGSDVCAFGGNATDEICARWFQLGSLYPFSRNHNEIQAIDQEPYALGNLTLQASIKNLKLRYSILKSYFREFINRRGFGSIFKPLFFEFFNDSKTYNDQIADTQFLLGNSLMSAPVLEEGKNSRQVYFPVGANWYDFSTPHRFYPSGSVATIVNKPDDLVPLFLREGHIIFQQDTTLVLRSCDLDNRFKLVGGFFFDERRSTETLLRYEAVGGTLSIRDYNEQHNVFSCSKAGCDYQIVAVYETDKKSSKQSLSLEIIFVGEKSLKEEIFITEVSILTKDGPIARVLAEPVSIHDSGRKVINLSSQQLNES